MLFPEADAPLLKAWIVKRLEDTSDADAEVLAEYIIALLKHDGTKDEIRKLCEAEIPDFLTEDPKAFLDDVFQTVAYKSYVPGAPPPPKLPAPGAADAAPVPQAPFEPMPAPQHGSKKRGYRDFDAPGAQETYYNGNRPMKNARRQGPDRGASGGEGMMMGDMSHMPMPPYDPDNPMAAFMSMGMPWPGAAQPFGPSGGRGGRQKRRGRCRDFDRKGYCARGSNCKYDHGNGNDWYPEMPAPVQMDDDYDPNNAVITLSNPNNHANPNPFPFESHQDSPRGRGGRKRGGRGERKQKNSGRAPFSAEGPVNDRSKSTIVVESIPEEHFSEEEVRGFFAQFGEVQEVSMQPYKRLAIVKFDKWASANAAYRSPKVIFDNRFVKVFWYKDVGDNSIPASFANGSTFNGDGDAEAAEAEPEMDPEELRQRQEEAQKQFEEKESKRSELERQRQELEKKQQELLEKHREETERLQSKLQEKNGGDTNGGAGSTGTGADMLRAKLAALEQEAKILGIDPDAAEDEYSSYPPPARGGWRGRAAPRARGRGAWRGGPGSFRGGGAAGGRHAAYAQYSIDNRPKKLAITGVDFTVPEKDESLRHFLLSLGEFESVEPSDTTTHVSFRDRKTAEKLYYLLNGKELPGVDGTLELSWVNGGPAPASAPPPATTTKKDDDETMEEEDVDITTAGLAVLQDEAPEVDYNEQRAEDEDAY